MALNNGTVDANLDYDLNIASRYNQTTDQLVISSSADLVGGDFSTATMDMDLSFPLDVLKLSGSWDLGLLGSGTFNLAAFHDDLTVDIPPGTFCDDSYTLDFIGQSIEASA